ncbi:hypothetical protein M408DRAFT_25035 [Serendipita vermifera MAFF 305830]|uniref:Uncharacterized protein n=1 Tax=Serendipita vermifera MAFF 305830 TaxID=933852 RepID=A0A0C3B3I7_SERVB|nr:hypothetical protein M408DRAFT_25035 [Serendipita vermifera MAFF 305830]
MALEMSAIAAPGKSQRGSAKIDVNQGSSKVDKNTIIGEKHQRLRRLAGCHNRDRTQGQAHESLSLIVKIYRSKTSLGTSLRVHEKGYQSPIGEGGPGVPIQQGQIFISSSTSRLALGMGMNEGERTRLRRANRDTKHAVTKKTIIIDDSNPATVYHGNWTTMTDVATIQTRGRNSNEYNSTVHRSTTAGDTLTFTFEGISLALWGTLDRPAVVGSPNVSFCIDGGAPVAFNHSGLVTSDLSTDYMPHMLLYKSLTLSKGSHMLNVSVPAIVQAPFYFDFLTIDAGEDIMAGDVIVDDTEFRYTGTWFEAGAQYEHLHTTHGIYQNDVDNATYSFFGR